jgi:hypothetical protein
VRRDGKDPLDFADIGGETDTTTHGASIAGRTKGTKRVGRWYFDCVSSSERLENITKAQRQAVEFGVEMRE